MTYLISPYILFFKLFPQDLYVYEGNKKTGLSALPHAIVYKQQFGLKYSM